MTKSEILARDKHIIDVVSGAVYRESGECINITMDGVKRLFPEWNFAACDYELFTPEFSWELFKEGLLLVSCNYKEYERFKVDLKAQGITQWADGESIESADPFSKSIVNNRLFGHQYNGLFLALTYPRKGNRIVVDFSTIPPELLKPAFEPRKPETFTPEEWESLTPDQCTACNELIRGEIEYDKNGNANNLEWYDPDCSGYLPTTGFTAIDTWQYQYRIKPKPEYEPYDKPKPEYEPYDKPEPWMIRMSVQLKTDNSVIREITGIEYGLVMLSHNEYTVSGMFNMYNHYDLNTGETRPFGKLKGGE